MGLAPIIGDLIGTMFGVVGPEWRLLRLNAVSASAAPVCLYAWAAPLRLEPHALWGAAQA